MLGHKRILENTRRLKSHQVIFSDQNGNKKLEINSKRKNEKFTNAWKLNIFPNNQWSKEELKGK